jgi:hypothetical protein
MLASVDDPADAHVWKGPGGSDDPTLVAGQKVLRGAHKFLASLLSHFVFRDVP